MPPTLRGDARLRVRHRRRGGAAPLLSVFGGKITTYRKLAEHALESLAPFLPASGPAWTAGAFLPGGDIPGADFEAFLRRFQRAHGLVAA